MNIGVQMNNAYYMSNLLNRSQSSLRPANLREKRTNEIDFSAKVSTYKDSDALRGLENGREQTDSVRRFRDSFDNAVRISAASTSKGIRAVETSLLSEEDSIRTASRDYVRENSPEIMISISSAGRVALETIDALNKGNEELQIQMQESTAAANEADTEASVSVALQSTESVNLNKQTGSADILNEHTILSSGGSGANASNARESTGVKPVSETVGNSRSTRTMQGRITGRANSAYSFQMKYRQFSDNLR